MDTKRLSHKNKLNLEIRNAETLIKRYTETISRLRSSQMGEEYVKTQIVKLKNIISEKEELVSSTKEQIKLLNTGGLDEQIEKEYKISVAKVNERINETLRIKDAKKASKQKDKEVSKKYWKQIINQSKAYKQRERDSRYALRHFNKAADTMPNYMKKNLQEMPQNKGYIWKDVHFYGYLPYVDNQPQIMFEKTRNNVLIIHEYLKHEYRIYEKHGKNRKQLVYKQPRRKIQNSANSLSDYVF